MIMIAMTLQKLSYKYLLFDNSINELRVCSADWRLRQLVMSRGFARFDSRAERSKVLLSEVVSR